jgi:hypothetical protein
MTFDSWMYALEEYSEALEEAGLLIERIREPLPSLPPGEHESVWKRSERIRCSLCSGRSSVDRTRPGRYRSG